MALEGIKDIEREGWTIDSIRFTYFPKLGNLSLEALAEWWSAFNQDNPPLKRQEERLPNGTVLLIVEGNWSATQAPSNETLQARLQIMAQLLPDPDNHVSRVDLYVLPLSNKPNASFPPAIENVSILSDFAQRLKRFLAWDKAPPAQRLAFGAVFLHKEESPSEVLHFLQDKLPTVKIDPDHTRDFVYRINRPLRFTMDKNGREDAELVINRINEWALVRFSSFVTISSGGALFTREHTTYFARLMLDINTDPLYKGKLFEQNRWAIAELLLSEGMRILRRGDSLPEGGSDD